MVPELLILLEALGWSNTGIWMRGLVPTSCLQRIPEIFVLVITGIDGQNVSVPINVLFHPPPPPTRLHLLLLHHFQYFWGFNEVSVAAAALSNRSETVSEVDGLEESSDEETDPPPPTRLTAHPPTTTTATSTPLTTPTASASTCSPVASNKPATASSANSASSAASRQVDERILWDVSYLL